MIMFNLLEKNQFGAAILLAAGLVLFNAKYLPAQTIKDVNSGETVNDLTVATGETYDTMNVNGGGIANTTTVNTGGNVTVNSGGTATGTIVNDGGKLTVDGGAANNTTINNGGNITATTSGSSIDNITISDGGTFDFSTNAQVANVNGSSLTKIADNVASGFNVETGSTLTAAAGGTIESTAVSGGTVVAQSGGIITSTAIGDNGTLIATEAGSMVDGAQVFSETGATFEISTDAEIANLQYGSQTINIQNNEIANLQINNASTLYVNANGNAENIALTDGGNLVVNTDGTATKINVLQNGEANVVGGTIQDFTVSGTLNASNSGTLSDGNILKGGEVNLSTNAQANTISVASGGTLNLGPTAKASDITVDGNMSIQSAATGNNLTINNGGVVNIEAGGTGNTVSVTSGGTLNTAATSSLTDLNALAASNINIADGTVINGTFTIDATTNTTGSSFDFSSLFDTSNTSLEELTLTGGVNSAFNNSLINQSSSDKTLTLANGNYVISDGLNGSVQVDGWNNINVTNGTVRLETDISMNGSEKNFIINTGASLDVSGTLDNVLNTTIDGNVINNGTIGFIASENSSAQDQLTITGDYTGGAGSLLVLDANTANGTSDKLVVGGDVYGSTNIYIQTASGALPGGNLLFAEANSGAADAFNIWRVEGSPYSWGTLFENNKWYGYVSDGNQPSIVPEVAAYYGLIDNMFMQTSSIGANLRNNIAVSEFRKIPCKNIRYTNQICRSNRPTFTGWIAPVYSSVTIDSPYSYQADISGLDAGLDLVGDGYTKFGVMGSFRNGKYTYDDNGDNYKIDGEAETTIDSYIGGVYMRHDSDAWSVVGAVYAGTLDADISTNDGVNADTSGSTYGATLDVNYIYQNINGFRIEPGVRISYSAVSVDEISDNAGKTEEFGDASRSEIEAGIRFAKRWEFDDAKAEIFARPAIIQTLNDSDDFELVDERFVESTEDRTLAKLEAGMSFDMIGNWSLAIAGSYTFGDSYQNTTANLSLQYNF